MRDAVLTLWQPWADLVMADDGAGGCWKPVENRGWRPSSTLPQWGACDRCGKRLTEFRPGLDMHMEGCGGRLVPDGPFPFRLWIHAGQRAEPANHPAWGHWFRTGGTDERGVLLGSVEVTGCHHADECQRTRQSDPYVDATREVVYCSRWADPDVWHWTLTDPRPLDEPIPMRGHQRLWNLAWHLDPQEIAHA